MSLFCIDLPHKALNLLHVICYLRDPDLLASLVVGFCVYNQSKNRKTHDLFIIVVESIAEPYALLTKSVISNYFDFHIDSEINLLCPILQMWRKWRCTETVRSRLAGGSLRGTARRPWWARAGWGSTRRHRTTEAQRPGDATSPPTTRSTTPTNTIRSPSSRSTPSGGECCW